MPRLLLLAQQHILCRGLAAVLLGLFTISAGAQQTTGSSTLRGEVHDVQGKPVSGATLHLQTESGSELQTVRTDENGRFSFSALDQGVYALRAQMSGYGEATLSSIFIAAQEAKTIDLTLGSEKSQPRASSAPEFFDQPQFTVSGVTDTTSLGGHGSDTIVRTRETIAKDTILLGKDPTGRDPAVSAATETDLRAKVEHDPHAFEPNRELGEFLVGQGNAREAIPYLDRAAKLKPADYESSYALAVANADAGNYERAREIAVALLPQHNQGELHHLLADVQEKLGNSLEAVREYERAATLDPSEPYLFDWGSELLLHHAPEPALEVFTKGNRLFPRSVRMLIGIGATWFARGSYDVAIERICQASDLDPKDSSPYLFLGRIESAAMPPATLVDKLHRFVTLQPENAAANYYYAVGLWKRRKPSGEAAAAGRVESLLNQAIHLDAKFAVAYLQLGILHSDQGDFSRAVSDYQQAIQADPHLEEAHYRLAQAYRQAGESDKAKGELQLYDQAVKESVQRTERERHEIRQFVYTLRDQPPAQK
jgi:tetratricopeptide (TPR) repeat protein